jgi:hypothetical protein
VRIQRFRNRRGSWRLARRGPELVVERRRRTGRGSRRKAKKEKRKRGRQVGVGRGQRNHTTGLDANRVSALFDRLNRKEERKEDSSLTIPPDPIFSSPSPFLNIRLPHPSLGQCRWTAFFPLSSAID